MTESSYLEAFVRQGLKAVERLEQEVRELTTARAVDARDIAELRRAVGEFTEWAALAKPQLAALDESARDARRRRADLTWKLVGVLAVAVASSLLTAWAKARELL